MNTWRYYHYWRDTGGNWHENRLPFYGRKPQIVVDRADNAYVVHCKGEDLNYHGRDPGGQLRIAMATGKTGWTDWKTVWVSTEQFVGEPLVDASRWKDDEILSVYAQEKPTKPGAPSALHVLDFRKSNAKGAAADGNGRRIARVPTIDGPWWQVAYSPALPEIGSRPGEVVDHCFFKAKSGMWQLWTQIRGTAVGRLFYRWEGGTEFERPDWEPKGICWRADRHYGESLGNPEEEFIHAPYVLQEDGRYVMYYGGGPSATPDHCQINVATSSDGVRFSRYRNPSGRSEIFSGPGWARDPMVLHLGKEYFQYYCGDDDGKGVIALRTSTASVGRPWSKHQVVSQGGTLGTGRASQQCPFVVCLDGYFYLFKMAGSNEYRTAVYRSENPRDFGAEDDQLVAVLKSSASEIIRVKGQFYISSLIPGYKGVRVARLRWDPPP
jgi:beta-fructofuranosidase